MNDILIKYLQGEASESEKAKLLDWMKQSEANKKRFTEIRDIWLATGASPLADPDYSKKAFRRFSDELNRLEKRKRQLRTNGFLRIAASVAILLLCSVGGYYVGHTRLQTADTGSQQIVMNRVIMDKGSKGAVTLPDGTLVWLNAGSELVYPEAFSSDHRQVKLKGEGYFEVVRNEKAPFYVETDGMIVNVLGTRFDVKNYESGTTLETVLLSGKVEVLFPATRKRIALEPNQKITCNKQTGAYDLKEVNASDYVIWINDKLVCTNERLADVLYKMKRWYGLDIVSNKGVPLEQRLSLTIRKESPEEIFKLLELIAPIRYTIQGDRIVVSPKK